MSRRSDISRYGRYREASEGNAGKHHVSIIDGQLSVESFYKRGNQFSIAIHRTRIFFFLKRAQSSKVTRATALLRVDPDATPLERSNWRTNLRLPNLEYTTHSAQIAVQQL